jgi:hypothetical protein
MATATDGCVDEYYYPTLTYNGQTNPLVEPVAQHIYNAQNGGLVTAWGVPSAYKSNGKPLTKDTTPGDDTLNRNKASKLDAAVSEFKAQHDMTIVPAAPGADSGRTVFLDPAILDLPEWKQAAASDARKKAAEQFLISRADGFCPPPLIRNELYARTRDLLKDRGSSGLFLSVRSAHLQRPSGTVRDDSGRRRPRRRITRALHIARALRHAHTRRGDDHRRWNLKEETCRTGS